MLQYRRPRGGGVLLVSIVVWDGCALRPFAELAVGSPCVSVRSGVGPPQCLLTVRGV